MRTQTALIVVFTGLLLLPGCEAITGEELARMQIDSLSTEEHMVMREVALPLKKGGEIAFWSDMDLEYDGEVELRMRVRVLKDGTDLELLEIDPLAMNVTVGETRTSMGGHTDWSFTGRNHVWMVPEDGTYVFKAILTASENPSLIINKAGLVLKQ